MGYLARVNAPDRTRVLIWALTFITFLLAGLAQAVSVDWTRPISEFDEIAHIDYAERLAAGGLTTWDDVYSQRTLGISECVDANSQDPNCITSITRDPAARWPDGHSYEAQQGPLGYLPYATAFAFVIDANADHFSQIRQLRAANAVLWLILGALWAFLLAMITARWWAALAATVVFALNPLLFDAFTYVNNDAASAVVGTAGVLWLIWLLKNPNKLSPAMTYLISTALGLVIALTKVTALIVVVTLVIGVLITRKRWGVNTPRTWWWAAGLITVTALIIEVAYLLILESRSTLTSHAAFDLMLPRGPLDLPASALIRLTDISEMVVGSGARTDQVLREAGMQTASAWLLIFAIAAAATFLIALGLPRVRYSRLPQLQPSGLGFGVLAAALLVLVVMPALWEINGGYLTYVSIGRYLTPLIAEATLVTVAVYERFTRWAQVTAIGGVILAAISAVQL
mgnify:CR=1 FL=1